MDEQSCARPFRVRRAGIGDALVIARQRAQMFLDMGRVTAVEADDLERAARPRLAHALRDGSYHGWLMVRPDGEVVAGAGVWLRPMLPRPDSLDGREALVVNVFVEPAHRRRGAARALMHEILAWCREQGIRRVVLHPSPFGKPLYESLGFVPTGELTYRPPAGA